MKNSASVSFKLATLLEKCRSLQVNEDLEKYCVSLAPNIVGIKPYEIEPNVRAEAIGHILASKESIVILPSDHRVDPESLSFPTTILPLKNDRTVGLFSSGTTGAPKLRLHALSALLATTAMVGKKTKENWATFYDVSRFAGFQALLQALINQQGLFFLSPKVNQKEVERITRRQVSAISGSPTQWKMLKPSEELKRASIKLVSIGGEIVDQRTLDKVKSIWPTVSIRHIYASTEFGVIATVKDGEVGLPANLLEGSTMVGPALKISAAGTLLVKTTRNSISEEISGSADSEGFYDTNDLVELKHDRIYFLGRNDNLTSVGGRLFAPEKTEQVLLGMDNISAARVYGVPHAIMGNVFHADIVADANFDKTYVLKECRSKLAKEEVPVKLHLVSSIEVTSTGKLKRLRDY